jgi:hypothetical protein
MEICRPVVPDHLRDELTIAPFFYPASQPSHYPDELEPLGIAVEFATQKDSFVSHIFRNVASHRPDQIKLTDILIEPFDFPVDFVYRPDFSVTADKGKYFPLESLLVGLYDTFRIRRSVFAVLTELRDCVAFNDSIRHHEPLATDAFNLGFAVTGILSYGTMLSVDVDWIPPQDRNDAQIGLVAVAAAMDFRPRPDGSLGKGTWIPPKNGFIRVLLCQELRKLFAGPPIDLFTESGKAELLSKFQWTPFTRLSKTQLEKARLQFLRNHPELLVDPNTLATAMHEAGLYPPSYRVSKIIKLVPGLINTVQAARGLSG